MADDTYSSSEDDLRSAILREIEDTEDAPYMYPHMAMVPDYFLRYWDQLKLAVNTSRSFLQAQTC